MAQAKAEVEFDELYQSRRLTVLWRVSKSWTLLSASVHTEWMQVELFMRQDQPHAPPHIRKLTFRTEEECDRYLNEKRLELTAEGWQEEEQS